MKPGRLVVSALRGGSGKTLITIGIVTAWVNSGKSIAPFKKGPDYIDTGWLALAAGRPCYNLDTFLIPTEKILHSFNKQAHHADIAVIEGNRGLYDGFEREGATSTAELSKLIDAPVLLCLDCTKSTRTMAAVVFGCLQFDPAVRIAGVILNRVAGARHQRILTQCIEHHCGVPIVGAIPKLTEQFFPERHMGLVPAPEHDWAVNSIQNIGRIAQEYIDLAQLETIADQQPTPTSSPLADKAEPPAASSLHVTIGIIKDSAFQFYYPENIEALIENGANIEYLSPLQPQAPPTHLDALYIGGGFPETHAVQLSQNLEYRNAIKRWAEHGMPIYAECGGLMYLGKELILEGESYPMAGVFDVSFELWKRPKGHGYTVLTVTGDNPYYPTGVEVRGHEFHYSGIKTWQGDDRNLVFTMHKGAGIAHQKDGLCFKNVLATYVHIHALGVPDWAKNFVAAAQQYQSLRLNSLQASNMEL